mgnify:CR=1 FL=1
MHRHPKASTCTAPRDGRSEQRVPCADVPLDFSPAYMNRYGATEHRLRAAGKPNGNHGEHQPVGRAVRKHLQTSLPPQPAAMQHVIGDDHEDAHDERYQAQHEEHGKRAGKRRKHQERQDQAEHVKAALRATLEALGSHMGAATRSPVSPPLVQRCRGPLCERRRRHACPPGTRPRPRLERAYGPLPPHTGQGSATTLPEPPHSGQTMRA